MFRHLFQNKTSSNFYDTIRHGDHGASIVGESVNKVMIPPVDELNYRLITHELSMLGKDKKLVKMCALIDEGTY
jgi:hypothetical protein